MADIGTAYVRIAPNMSGIQGKIAAGFKGAGADAAKKLGDEVDSNAGGFQKAIANLGGVAKAGGLAIAAGLTAGVAGFAALTTKALMAGADLEQSLGGAEAVFGQYSKGIIAAADDAYTNAGLSQNEFLAGANKMGSLFQGAGFDVQSSMKMSADAMQRASDVASIMGLDTTTALEAVTGMAKGNFTMMDNLGVAMNDTALGAYALSKGIKKSTSEMSTQEKVGLANQLFLEKTAKYAGNYAKENDSLSGSLNTTKKAFEDFLSTGNVTGFVNSLVHTIEIAIPKIIELLPKMVDGIGSILTALVPALSASLPVLIPALIGAASALLQGLVEALPDVVKVLLDALPTLINTFIELFIGIVNALPMIVDVLTQAMPTIIDALVNGLTNPEALTAIIMGAIELFLAIVEAIPIILPALIKAIPVIIQNIVSTLLNPQFISSLIRAGFELIKAVIVGIYQTASAVGTAVVQIYNIMKGVLSWENMKSFGGDMIKGLWQGITDLYGWIVGKIKGFSSDVLGSIKGFFGIHSPSTVFAGIGADLNRGLAQGIDQSTGLVTSSVTDMSNEALAALGSPNMTAAYSVGGLPGGGQPGGSAGNSQSVTIGHITLGDAGAVKEFFKQLNQDSISAGLGITPTQGATA